LFVYWDTEERASRRLDAFAAKDELFAQLISKPLMKNNLVKLMCKHDLSKEGELLKIHPVGVNFAVHGPIGDIVDAKHLCSIPHWDIISFLTDLDRHTSGGAMHGIKTFPEHLRKKFAKEGVAYCDETRFHNIEYNSEMEFSDRISNYVDEKWNREKGVVIYSSYLRHHWFSAKYFSVGMHIQFFDEPDEEMRQLLQ
jgi:hypothetical protein